MSVWIILGKLSMRDELTNNSLKIKIIDNKRGCCTTNVTVRGQ